jgi:hypothetical protein
MTTFEYTFHLKPTEDGRCIVVETGEYWEPLVLTGFHVAENGAECYTAEPEAALSNLRRLAERIPS